ncbi:MAG TPA: hypothetical protein VG889_21300 [Rhizomicrobium sp.]|nr:hypothetical protein [Rhizomicrobium sp.]
MRTAILALVSLSCIAVPASAMDLGGMRQRDTRAFWLKPQGWSNPQPEQSSGPPPQTKFTTTYTAGVARRFGLGGGHLDFFARPLGGAGGPALAGTVDGGAAKLVLRWRD